MDDQRLVKIYEGLKSDRGNWETLWQDIFDHYMPYRDPVTYAPTQGETRSKKIYDTAPVEDLERLAAIIMSMLTNPATKWLEIETDDDEANQQQVVKEWLAKNANIFLKSLDNSNFYAESFEWYLDTAGPGHGVLYTEESRTPGKDLHFSARPISECYILLDDQGNVIGMFRKVVYTAHQILEKWRNTRTTGKIPDAVRKADAKDDHSKPFEILHAVIKNDRFVPDSIRPVDKQYSSAWIDIETKKEIHRGGYDSFPYAVMWWRRAAAETYGRSPALVALPDTKILYAMAKTTIRVAEKVVDPPMEVPDDGYINGVNLTPGGMNFYRAGTNNRITPITIGANFPVSFEMQEQKRDAIRNTFYLNQLQLIDKREMTAEEARLRISQNAQILGPVFGRLCNGLAAMVERGLDILGRLGRLEEPPAILEGKNFRFRYINPVSRAQQSGDVQAIQQTAQTAIVWAERTGRDDILDNINFDKGIRRLANADGAPSDFINDEKVVKATRDQRRAMREQEMKLRQDEARAGINRTQAEADRANREAA